ncbi:MAG: hypothetical protein DLM69_03595 [Candidatus Chloroheliales bacterium]|nr:MAG: hypothetical protein DLM69_03595 [Chloroflexota bacterium]
MTSMNTGNQQNPSSGMTTSSGKTGKHDSPLTDATFNMVAALHNLTKSIWHCDEYIGQEDDSDAKEMWQRFRQQQAQMAEELKNHLSRRLQHQTGPEGKVGHGPHEGGQGSGQ